MWRDGPGRIAAALALGCAVLACLVSLVGDVPGDPQVLAAFSSGRRLDPVARVVDRWTGYLPVIAFTTLLAVTSLWLGRRRQGVLVGVSVAGAILGSILIKRLVARPRPELLPPLAEVSRFSFPSGHAVATAALGVALVLATRGTRWLLPTALVTTLVVVVAAAAQLLLALHHPSDVLAGWLWAAAWTTAVHGWSFCWPTRCRPSSLRTRSR